MFYSSIFSSRQKYSLKASCAWGDTQMQFVQFLNHSEVKFVCLIANSPISYVNKALKIWISLAHT